MAFKSNATGTGFVPFLFKMEWPCFCSLHTPHLRHFGLILLTTERAFSQHSDMLPQFIIVQFPSQASRPPLSYLKLPFSLSLPCYTLLFPSHCIQLFLYFCLSLLIPRVLSLGLVNHWGSNQAYLFCKSSFAGTWPGRSVCKVSGPASALQGDAVWLWQRPFGLKA